MIVFVFKQKTAYEMRIRDWSSDVCSSDLRREHIGRVRGPVFDLAGDAQGRPAAIAACRVAGEFLVGEIGIIEPVAGRLNDIDALAALSGREFAAPDRRFERSGAINPRSRFFGAVIARPARREQVADGKVGARAVLEGGVCVGAGRGGGGGGVGGCAQYSFRSVRSTALPSFQFTSAAGSSALPGANSS